MSAGDSKVLLQSGAAAGALRLQRHGAFGLIPSNILGHRRRTSHKHYCMFHCRSLLHRFLMSRNQSRTMGLTWILRRFVPRPLGLVFECSNWGRAGVPTWAISS